jgi:hypothetical protein
MKESSSGQQQVFRTGHAACKNRKKLRESLLARWRRRGVPQGAPLRRNGTCVTGQPLPAATVWSAPAPHASARVTGGRRWPLSLTCTCCSVWLGGGRRPSGCQPPFLGRDSPSIYTSTAVWRAVSRPLWAELSLTTTALCISY